MITAYEHNIRTFAKVTPSMSYSGSLAAWQPAARKKLAELLGMDRFVAADPELSVEFDRRQAGFREIRFTFQSEAGYRLPCHLWLPEGVERPPLMICLQGHSTGMHISMGRPKFPGDAETISGGDRDFCVRAVAEGFAALALEQRSFGECGGTEKGPDCLPSALTALLSGRTTIGERVWDISRAIDVLCTEFSGLFDAGRICCMGNSGGGTATAYAAALEDRLVLAMPSCAMCTFRDSIGAMFHCACNFVPHIGEYFDMGDLLAMACPKCFVQVSGKEDGIFPIGGAREVFSAGKAAYDSLGLGHRCQLVEGEGGHRFYADAAWPQVHRLMENL
ncbi:MAG: hypothetical protein IKL89_07725 [Clostridia bacterium]|nr:hypothetical protein [Clostridia bacterium]